MQPMSYRKFLQARKLNCFCFPSYRLYTIGKVFPFDNFKSLRAPFFVTEWVVAHGPKNDYPHISLKDNSWWANKRGIIFLLRSTFVFQKIRKNCTTCRPLQIWRTLVRRVSTQELRSWKVQKQVRVFSFCIFVWEVLANYLSRKPGVFV